MIEWQRLTSLVLGCVLSIPVFFIGNTLRFFKVGRRLFHVKTRDIPPDCLMDPKYGEHKYMSGFNGVKIHYLEVGDVTKPLLLFVHGWPQFWFSWRHQIEHFKKDYHVVAIDMRGFGDSDKPVGIENYSIMNLVFDIRDLVINLDKSTFTLIGHDWGGFVCWTFASFYPQMLENLIVCNIPHPIAFFQSRRKGLKQLIKSWYMHFFQVPMLPELQMLSEDMKAFQDMFQDNPNNDSIVVECYKYAFRNYEAWNRTINYYRCLTYNKSSVILDESDPRWKIKVRTLHIFGTADTAIDVEPAKESIKWVENYTLEMLEGVSHWVQEHEPEKVNNLIENFIIKEQ